MATAANVIRSKKVRTATGKIKTIVYDHHDHDAVVSLTPAADDMPNETWEFAVEGLTASVTRTDASDDVAATPEPPEWVRDALLELDLSLAEDD